MHKHKRKEPGVRMKPVYHHALLIALFLFLHALPLGAQDSTGVWVNQVAAPQYFAVLVGDVNRSVEWYQTAFGLSKVGGSEAEDMSWEIVNLRNQHLFVEIIRDDRAREVDRTRGLFKVGFQVPDVRVVADAVARATGERPRVSEFQQYGVRIIQLRDPDGNIIQLASSLEGLEPPDWDKTFFGRSR